MIEVSGNAAVGSGSSQQLLEDTLPKPAARDLSEPYRDYVIASLPTLKVLKDSGGICYLRDGARATVFALESRAGQMLIRRKFAEKGFVPTKKELTDTIDCLLGAAMLDHKEFDVWNRVAPVLGGVELDVGDDVDTRIRVTPGKVEIIPGGTPTLFYRTPVMRPMMLPADSGDINLFLPYLNVSAIDRWLLIAWITYIMACPKHVGRPFPLLVFIAGQGSGKTLLCRLIQKIVDPNSLGVQTFPHGERELAIAAAISHLSAWDNLRRVSPLMSDALCRVVTGGTFSKRKLYSDADLMMIRLQGAMILNSIHPLVDQPDLAQRSLQMTLLPIDEANRRAESDIARDFDRDLPKILRGLLDLIAGALIHLPTVRPTSPDRLIDFCCWLAAIEQAQGIPGDPYQTAYSDSLRVTMRDSLEEHPLAGAIIDLLNDLPGARWSGMPTELLSVLGRRVRGKVANSDEWPQNAIALSKRLRPLMHSLNQQGIEIRFARGSDRTISIVRTTEVDHD